MNAREKQLIEGIINSENKRLHNRCIQLLFHGQDVAGSDERVKYKERSYAIVMENAVRICFSGRLYQKRFSEVYTVFESIFVQELERTSRNKPEVLRGIVDLKSWLFQAAKNCCNSNRKEINELLGIKTGSCFAEFDDNTKVEDQDDETTLKGDCLIPQGEDSDVYAKTSDEDNPELSDEFVKETDTSSWAELFLGSLIDKISNDYYRDLIRAIKLEKVPVDTIAEEEGKTVDDIYRDCNRAWNKLLQVALSEVRIRCKSLFKKYESKLNDEQAQLLNVFFFSGKDLSTIARLLRMKQNDLENAIIKAHKVLVKIANRETELDEKEKRQEAREQRRLEKEEAVRKKKQENATNDRNNKFSNSEVIENPK